MDTLSHGLKYTFLFGRHSFFPVIPSTSASTSTMFSIVLSVSHPHLGFRILSLLFLLHASLAQFPQAASCNVLLFCPIVPLLALLFFLLLRSLKVRTTKDKQLA